MTDQRLASFIRSHVLKLLAAREYTRSEMHGRLLRWLKRRRSACVRHKVAAQAEFLEEVYSNNGELETETQNSRIDANYVEVINQVLDKLEKTGLLNDKRAAEAFVRNKSERFGVARVRQELKNKGVDVELATQVLEDLQNSEFNRAYKVWQKKYGKLPQNQKEYARQLRFLASRGFAADITRKILQGKVEL